MRARSPEEAVTGVPAHLGSHPSARTIFDVIGVVDRRVHARLEQE
jgi:hypothetical protein